MTELTPGEQLARRRKAIGWNQRTLAKKAGVALGTVLRVEKDRNTQRSNYDAISAAILKEETRRGAGPTLSTPVDTKVPLTKEGADVVTRLREARRALQNSEVFLDGALKEIRRGLAALDESTIDAIDRRKIG